MGYETEDRYTEALRTAQRLARLTYAGWSPEPRDDLVGVTMQRFFRHVEERGWPENLEAFLRVAIRNNARNLADQQARRLSDPGGMGDSYELGDARRLEGWLNELRLTPSMLVMRDMAVQRVLGLLSEHDARLLRLRYLDNRRVREIGAELGMHPDAVSRALSRALRRLQEALEDRPEILSELRM